MNESSTNQKDIYKNDEWRKRDFEEDYIKNVLNEFKVSVSISHKLNQTLIIYTLHSISILNSFNTTFIN